MRDAVAHNIDGQRTIGAVYAYLAALIEARRTLGPAASARELEYGATALDLHMPIAAFRRIGPARSSLGPPLALIVAVDLVHRGVPMDWVGRHFVELVETQVTDTELLGLSLRVERARVDGSVRRVRVSFGIGGDPIGASPPSTASSRSSRGKWRLTRAIESCRPGKPFG